MESLCQFILEFVLEGIFGLTLENPKTKTWVKTVIMILMDLLILGLFPRSIGGQRRKFFAEKSAHDPSLL